MGVCRELEAQTVIEPVDRLHQADIPLLNQIQESQPAAPVFLGHGHDQPQVRLHQFLLGINGLALRVADAAEGSARLLPGHAPGLLPLLQFVAYLPVSALVLRRGTLPEPLARVDQFQHRFQRGPERLEQADSSLLLQSQLANPPGDGVANASQTQQFPEAGFAILDHLPPSPPEPSGALVQTGNARQLDPEPVSGLDSGGGLGIQTGDLPDPNLSDLQPRPPGKKFTDGKRTTVEIIGEPLPSLRQPAGDLGLLLGRQQRYRSHLLEVGKDRVVPVASPACIRPRPQDFVPIPWVRAGIPAPGRACAPVNTSVAATITRNSRFHHLGHLP